ncbi:two-component sensor histidine kinase [Rhodococcus rhodnii]|uniref:Sensor-like histidine kinase SenX3 n=2 Tax=Rhodococcus rhodnii TaxID=38312 RepID=R7WPI0_9NOCA|nr:ATP-binding protein [Rhodococcus rhodnii]EOM77222.1 sensor kinase [Rhodococcus rhodnii LMG 5362]TXG91983.1 two-component sensor histidine kinase [Rhodococcus rhodnii]
MTVAQAVLLAVVFGVAGYLVRALLVPALTSRSDRRVRAVEGPTTSEVLAQVVDRSEVAIAVVDRFEDVVLSNPRAEELGVVRHRVLDDRVWNAVQRVFATGEPCEIDLSSRALRGRPAVSVRVGARKLGDAQDRFVMLLAQDDSEAVRMEATRRDFVANVSHELKTPVGAMALLAEALLETADDPEAVVHFGERLHTESLRLGRMVTELIALSRLQGAEKLPDLGPVAVDEVVEQALARTRLSAEASGITVATDGPSGTSVLGDRDLLVTAVTNLVQNAIAYSPEGSPVSVSRTLRDGTVCISVTDRGVGIAKEDQERVFERFFRVDKARSRATGGTGLGLAIVKHVAANHNGSIELWSRPGTGSTFTLQLPQHVTGDGDQDDDVRPDDVRHDDVRADDPRNDERTTGTTRGNAADAQAATQPGSAPTSPTPPRRTEEKR